MKNRKGDEVDRDTDRGPARFLKYDQSIGPSQIVGNDSLEAKIAEQVNHAARIRESMARISCCKTDMQFAVDRKPIPGSEARNGEHVLPEFKRKH